MVHLCIAFSRLQCTFELKRIMWIIILHDGANFGRCSRYLISFVDCDEHISFSPTRMDSLSSWIPLTKYLIDIRTYYPDMACALSILLPTGLLLYMVCAIVHGAINYDKNWLTYTCFEISRRRLQSVLIWFVLLFILWSMTQYSLPNAFPSAFHSSQ